MDHLGNLVLAALPELRMDSIDWVVFAIAIAGVPFSIGCIIRWWLTPSTAGPRRDWQSFWLIFIGLVCMIAVVCWYLFKFILRGRT